MHEVNTRWNGIQWTQSVEMADHFAFSGPATAWKRGANGVTARNIEGHVAWDGGEVSFELPPLSLNAGLPATSDVQESVPRPEGRLLR